MLGRGFRHSTLRAFSNATNNAGGGTPGDFVAHIKDVGVTLPNGKKLFERINLGFLNGAKIGILGSNGTGKSSLMKVLAGVTKDFDGERWCKPGLRIGYLQQEPHLDPTKTVFENVMDGIKESTSLLQRFDEVSMAMGEPDADFDKLLEEQATLQEKIESLDCWDLTYEVEKAMAALRVPPGDSDVTVLSGGERRRVALCRLLLEKPDMLLLDEPTNHLDAESVSWLETYLKNYKGTVLSITHDRYFLDNVAGWILELERGNYYVYEGNYSYFLSQKKNRLNMDKRREAIRARQLAEELEWVQTHQGNKKGSKARQKQIDDLKNDSGFHQRDEGQIVIPAGARLGNKVMKISNICKTIDGKVLLDNVSFEVEPRSIVGIVGPNGAGKSTLFNIITDNLEPDSGSIELGKTVQMGFVSQSRQDLRGVNTVYEEVSGDNEFVEVCGERINTRAYIASFNLKGPMQEKKVSQLSGGERNRVHLAKMLLGGHNVILLDEPTNDLDVDTLRSLELALVDFQGVSMVISHDRWFLDRIATHILSYDGNGKATFYRGNYSEFEADRAKGLV
ncbi:ATP-binding Cassette (ABC) Superfamily [Thraustotheca clavata]|uniref:ATP-binding Cassette (ABC) Superfamily n=1 Tax=Thraustotheca clavata TaxID=74557 RepID=A0A1V9YXQ1_9STRA|nr:ATP-binding Cassette (ABC) Superfamily [Thraustotheca clavata]